MCRNNYLYISGPMTAKLILIYMFQDQNFKLTDIYVFQDQKV